MYGDSVIHKSNIIAIIVDIVLGSVQKAIIYKWPTTIMSCTKATQIECS